MEIGKIISIIKQCLPLGGRNLNLEQPESKFNCESPSVILKESLKQKIQIGKLDKSELTKFNDCILAKLSENQQNDLKNIIYSPSYLKLMSDQGGLAKSEEDAWQKYLVFLDVYFKDDWEEIQSIIDEIKTRNKTF